MTECQATFKNLSHITSLKFVDIILYDIYKNQSVIYIKNEAVFFFFFNLNKSIKFYYRLSVRTMISPVISAFVSVCTLGIHRSIIVLL